MSTAVVGVMLVVAMYLTARCLRFGIIASAFCAWLVLFDNLICLQSRLILTDAFLFLFVVASVGMSFVISRFTVTTAVPTKYQLFALATTGLFIGLALSVKLTALGVVGLVGAHQALLMCWHLHVGLQQRTRHHTTSMVFGVVALDTVWRAGLLLGCAAFTFFTFWTFHIYALPYNGQGTDFMAHEFKRTLSHKPPTGINGPSISTAFNSMSLIDKISHVVRTTWNINQGGGALLNHPQKSSWYQWPLHTCRVVEFFTLGDQHIRGMGNPFAWWLVVLFIAIHLLRLATNSFQKVRLVTAVTLTIGYFGNLLPYTLIERATWNYHYIPALLVGILIAGLGVDDLVRAASSPRRLAGVVLLLAALMAGVALVFWYFLPFTYGNSLTDSERQAHKWWYDWGL
eukprot:c12354_g1_i2.p1 GENE.c12354_g1_i2~~c12354_g1_i2.p1  ORF type:complete len:400 (+),score=106.90 c12354_g1_i2:511-1710(+)